MTAVAFPDDRSAGIDHFVIPVHDAGGLSPCRLCYLEEYA